MVNSLSLSQCGEACQRGVTQRLCGRLDTYGKVQAFERRRIPAAVAAWSTVCRSTQTCGAARDTACAGCFRCNFLLILCHGFDQSLQHENGLFVVLSLHDTTVPKASKHLRSGP